MATFDVVVAHLLAINHLDVDPNTYVFHENRNFYVTYKSPCHMLTTLIIFPLNFGVQSFSYRDYE